MRLFKSNKSQASIDRLTGSRSGSPTQPEPAYPQTPSPSQTQTQHQPQLSPSHYSGAHFQVSHPQPPHLQHYGQRSFDDSRYNETQVQSHPAHVLTRSQSSRIPSGTDTYATQRPTVNIVPHTPASTTIPEVQLPTPTTSGQTAFGEPKQGEKEHKRSKRSLFGLTGSKDKDKDKENSPIDRKGLVRTGSVHLNRRYPPIHTPIDTQPQSPQHTSPQTQIKRHSLYSAHPDSSTENIPEHPSHYEQQHTQYGQHDSPRSQYSRQPSDFREESGRYSSSQGNYQPYQHPIQDNSSDQYLPYQPSQDRSSGLGHDQYQALRPPSQASLGPPSPLPNSHQESRPSTSATNRYSSQSLNLPIQGSAPQMARGDPPNGSLRQQISQNRDPRSGEEHNQYQSQSQSDSRSRISTQTSEQGRSTPPPRNREDPATLDYHQLLQRHEELQAKYSKVKRYYFEREAQVTHLQNTVANQRLSMSKTSLDDAQYSQRFERLSGAINNLAFNIRKCWRAVPPWLRHVCNQDAHSTGTKEMTAVGRACVTRWLFCNVFERIFHPGLEPGLSSQLKNIERNLRRTGIAASFLTDEQRDDLVTKITTWRLTTIEGLQDVLSSRQSEHHIENLTKDLTHNLTETLKVHLTDPPPAGLNESVAMIVGQTLGICSNIPLESRDICVEYYLPGTIVNEIYMKSEPGMTPLSNPGQDMSMEDHGGDAETASTSNEGDRDVEAEIREASAKASQFGSAGNGTAVNQAAAKSAEKQAKKSSFLGGFVNKKPAPQTRMLQPQGNTFVQMQSESDPREERGHSTRENSTVGLGDSMTSLIAGFGTGGTGGGMIVPGPANNEGKIRFAAFLAVEVRGKNMASNKDVNSGSGGGSGGNGAGSAAGGISANAQVNVLYKAPVYEF